MTFIKIVWLVARWEFMCTVRRVSFLTALISLPVAHFALAALIAFSMRSALDDPPPDLPIAIVDEGHVLDPIPGERAIVLQHADGALDALRRGEVEAVYVLDKEYLAKGKVRSYSPPVKGLTQFGVRMEQRERASALLRKGLVRESNDRSRRLVEPIASLDSYRVERGVVTVETPFAVLGVLAGPFGVCFVYLPCRSFSPQGCCSRRCRRSFKTACSRSSCR